MKTVSLSTYFLGAAIAVIMAWATTGCRFGNNVEYRELEDPVTGFYENQPQSYEICSVKENLVDPANPIEDCDRMNTNQIPALIRDIMSNPVAVQLINSTSGDTQIFSFSPTATTALPAFVDMTQAENAQVPLSLIGTSVLSLPWNEPNCQINFGLDLAGQLEKYSQETTVSGIPTRGNITLSVIISYEMSGQCEDALSYMESCYLNQSNCNDSTDFDFIDELFQPPLSAGVLGDADISEFKSYSYEVSYQ